MHSRRVVSCPVQPRACHWSCVFWRDFSGVKRTCWTTGSWRSCLSPEVVSSIPAGSTIIYRFLCGFICVSLCQSIKIKPTNIYFSSFNAKSWLNDIEDIGVGQRSLHVAHTLMLVIICAQYGKNPSRTVCAVERTRQDVPYFGSFIESDGQAHTSLRVTHLLMLVIICAQYGKNSTVERTRQVGGYN